MNGDIQFFDFPDNKPNHVGIVKKKPRNGWRHRWAIRSNEFKMIEANVQSPCAVATHYQQFTNNLERGKSMNEQEVNQKFDDIVQPKVINQIIKQKRPPAKFPELRYLWGITLLGSFALMVLASIVQTFLA